MHQTRVHLWPSPEVLSSGQGDSRVSDTVLLILAWGVKVVHRALCSEKCQSSGLNSFAFRLFVCNEISLAKADLELVQYSSLRSDFKFLILLPPLIQYHQAQFVRCCGWSPGLHACEPIILLTYWLSYLPSPQTR